MDLAPKDLMLEVRSLTKKYGETVAVDGLNLSLKSGEVYGLLGPNGSGKSTIIRMLTGILSPNSGTVVVGGYDLLKSPEKAKSLVGYVPDEPVLYEKLSALEFLDFVGELYAVPRSMRRERARGLLKTLDMKEREKDLIESYSKGMRQKVSIAAALLHNPRVLIMDEPVTGLDPISARILKEMIRRTVRSGASVLISTHILEIAETLCDRVGILSGGKLIAEGTMPQLRDRASQLRFGGDTLEDIFIGLAAGEEYKELILSLETKEATLGENSGSDSLS